MIEETIHTDIAVLGGGLAGICAAIGAARRGKQVVLAQNRPVLGGNSSSEVRVWVCGATAHGIHLFARETGIMGELFVENQYRNPEGNPYYWDLLLLEKVQAEPNITLLLNTDVTEVEADGPDDARVIRSVTGWMSGSERRITIEAPTFIDCTGDGLVGYLAGAEYMTGREPRSQFGESWAPDVPDQNMLGSTILFYSKDVGEPSKFVKPAFAIDVQAAGIPQHRVIRQDMKGCAFWWVEWGGELDVVHDNERIRDELQAVCYGLWDHIKNSGEFDAENLTLEWVGSVPGKREYRRFVGEHVLTQQDVLRADGIRGPHRLRRLVDRPPPLRRRLRHRARLEALASRRELPPPAADAVLEERHEHVDGRPQHLREPRRLRVHARDGDLRRARRGSRDRRGALPGAGRAAVGARARARGGSAPRDGAGRRLGAGVENDDPADLALQADVRASSTKTDARLDAERGARATRG